MELDEQQAQAEPPAIDINSVLDGLIAEFAPAPVAAAPQLQQPSGSKSQKQKHWVTIPHSSSRRTGGHDGDMDGDDGNDDDDNADGDDDEDDDDDDGISSLASSSNDNKSAKPQPQAAGGAAASSTATAVAATPGNSARRADPLQHQNHARAGITIAAAYASGGHPAYSARSSRPYVYEKMGADIPPLMSRGSATTAFDTTVPVPLEVQARLALDPHTQAPLIARAIRSAACTTGPLPDAVLECILPRLDSAAPAEPPPRMQGGSSSSSGGGGSGMAEDADSDAEWTPADLDALDRGLEAHGKNFTRISRDHVRTRSTAACIHAYYSRKHELRTVRVRRYKKKVGRDDDDYARYVTGLGKYIALETKRMKAEKTGKSATFFAGSVAAAAAAACPANAIRVGNEIIGLMGSVKDVGDPNAGNNDDGYRGVRTRRTAAANV
ncbi:hypothetical protein HDU83_005220 [Entophlyctis luteolus]|nr:hypothetical protein HDU83_005220 [Entophlyctis luteolus]KAJ3388753.1 hypothetical protein HDU84_009449 [Entophlyctis sp. JEL0112]